MGYKIHWQWHAWARCHGAAWTNGESHESCKQQWATHWGSIRIHVWHGCLTLIVHSSSTVVGVVADMTWFDAKDLLTCAANFELLKPVCLMFVCTKCAGQDSATYITFLNTNLVLHIFWYLVWNGSCAHIQQQDLYTMLQLVLVG